MTYAVKFGEVVADSHVGFMIPGLENQGLTVEPRKFTKKLNEETNSRKAPSAPNSRLYSSRQ